MNALEFLKKDHRHISTLIDNLGNTGGSAREPQRQMAFEELKKALDIHTGIERNIFYPAVKKPGKSKTLVEKLSREHRKLNRLLSRLERISGSWDDHFSDFKKNIEQHILKVEAELFPKAEELLGEKELNELGQRMGKSAGSQSDT